MYFATRVDIITIKHFIILREKKDKIHKKTILVDI